MSRWNRHLARILPDAHLKRVERGAAAVKAQTAELFVTVVNGSTNIIRQPIPNWIANRLILQQSQRSIATERLRAFAHDRDLPLESASLVSGKYKGTIILRDRYYVLQLVEDKAIVHDLSIVKLPQTLSSALEINYDGGVVNIRE